MNWYDENVAPRLIGAVCSWGRFDRWRREATAGLAGTVLEIGFGNGQNLGFYPPAVERVLAVEPSPVAWAAARERVAQFPGTVELVGDDAARLELADASCDHVVSTFTLCSVGDLGRAAREIARVLRPGGTVRLVEHGLAPSPRMARWQWRLDGIEQRLAGGCHLTREPVGALERAGLAGRWSRAGYAVGPSPWSYVTIAELERPR